MPCIPALLPFEAASRPNRSTSREPYNRGRPGPPRGQDDPALRAKGPGRPEKPRRGGPGALESRPQSGGRARLGPVGEFARFWAERGPCSGGAPFPAVFFKLGEPAGPNFFSGNWGTDSWPVRDAEQDGLLSAKSATQIVGLRSCWEFGFRPTIPGRPPGERWPRGPGAGTRFLARPAGRR